MKKITLLFLLVFSFIATFSQTTYPVTQNLGSPQTLVLSKGGLKADSSLILPSFPDTTSANTSLYIKNYPGNMIRVGNNVYVRNSTATAWIGVGGGGGGSVSISQGYGITNTPNPITTTGTIKVDTSFSTGLSGKYFRLSDTAKYLKIDNLSASYPMFTDLFVDGVGISIFAVDNNNDGYLTIADYKKFTNKVDTIYRTPGKDSIIFNINGTRRAIKDSSGGSGTTTTAVDTIYRTIGKDSIQFKINGRYHAIKDSSGGGGGTPAGSNGYVQFNNSGSFGADSSLFWNNTNKRLGIGTASPQVPLDIAGGAGPRLLVYGTTGTPEYLAGVGVNMGDAPNSQGFFIGQNSSFSIDQANDFENFPYPNGLTSRFVVAPGGSVGIGTTSPGYKLHVNGDEYIEDKLVTNAARQKHVTYLNDADIGDNFTLGDYEHIIIYSTNNYNCTIYLPVTPIDGRELVIKQTGDIFGFSLKLDANGQEISGDSYAYIDSTQNSASVTIVFYDGIWYIINGVIYQ